MPASLPKGAVVVGKGEFIADVVFVVVAPVVNEGVLTEETMGLFEAGVGRAVAGVEGCEL